MSNEARELACERAEDNFRDHLDEWLFGVEDKQEAFLEWITDTPVKLTDLAETVKDGNDLLEQLVYAWWKDKPTEASAFWDYAERVEYANLTDGPEYEPD